MFLGPVVVGLLGTGGDVLSWLLVVVVFVGLLPSEIGKIVSLGADVCSCLC